MIGFLGKAVSTQQWFALRSGGQDIRDPFCTSGGGATILID
jgi:hypothetical protein